MIVMHRWRNFSKLAIIGLPGMSCLSSFEFSTTTSCSNTPTTLDSDSSLHALSPKEFRRFSIRAIHQVTHNTKQFTIGLPSKNHEMGLDVASFVLVKGPKGADGKDTVRPYTPTSTNDQKGYFELMTKSYPTGVVSSYLHSLQVGDSIEVKGPINKFKYRANMKQHIGMIAGGTGITPMLQIIKEIVKNPADNTKVSLIFANTTEGDILLKRQLDDIAWKHPNITVTYILSQPSQSWRGHKGYVNEDLVRSVIPPPSCGDAAWILVCGPPGFMETVSGDKTPNKEQGPVSGILKKIGYHEDQVFKF